MGSHNSVNTVLVPAAGLGTRMLPATKAFPKELLPIVDRPIIQYGVEEAARSGIKNVVLVTNPGNTLTESHFAHDPLLESILSQRGKSDLLTIVRRLSAMAEVTSVPQSAPLGLGHAVLCGKEAIGNAPFAVMLPDDVIDANPPALKQMLEVFADVDGPVLLVERVPNSEVNKYGVIAANPVRDSVVRVTDLVEKPNSGDAPSDLAIVGRYILTPDVFDMLESTGAGADGEIQLTDGLRQLLIRRPIHACILNGTRHDAGTKLGFLCATLHFALKRPDLAPKLQAAIAKALADSGAPPSY